MGTASSLLSSQSFNSNLDAAKVIAEATTAINGLADGGGRVSLGQLSTAVADIKSKLEESQEPIAKVLAKYGLLLDDPRLQDVLQKYDEGHDGLLSSSQEWENMRQHSVLIHRALSGDLIVPDFEGLKADFQEMYDEVLPDKSGANADYIPQLSEKHVDPELFGVSVCTIDGQRMSIGDTSTRFGVQSTSKAISYCIAQTLHGSDHVHKHVGMEPSGRPFNEMCLDERARDADLATKSRLSKEEAADFKVRPAIPHNPMINAGAIMVASMLWRDLPLADRFDNVTQVWNDLVGFDKSNPNGAKMTFANSMYLSELETASRNFCLGYIMEEAGSFMDGTNLLESLKLYFMCCSLELTSDMMAIIAACLANGGVNPLTGKRIFEQTIVKNCLSLMGSCGMYDYSGQVAFSMGFPAKSGVGGGILIVIPGVMGICTFSPRLDDIGNSARGVAFCHAMSRRYAFHSYDSLVQNIKKYPSKRTSKGTETRQTQLLWAASLNDTLRATHLLMRGCLVNGADYDKRTALHLASSCGHLEMARHLIHNGADPALKDRFGNTAADDARRCGHKELESYLSSIKEPVECNGKSAKLLAMGSKDGKTISVQRINELLKAVGLEVQDKRLADHMTNLAPTIDSATFDSLFNSSDLLRRALTGTLVLQDFSTLRKRFRVMYDAVKTNTGGHNATYIPILAEQNPNSWGVAICSIDGQRMNFGDTQDQFCVQSCSKAISYCIAIAENGAKKVSQHIGREPSGRPYNEMILDRRVSPAVPHNPCINAGAIMSCALIQGEVRDSEDRISHCMDNYWQKLAGKSEKQASTRYDRSTYKSESGSADRNRCLAYMMSEAKSFPETIANGKDLMENLEFYFKCCSILEDSECMATIAATLANGGVCPVTNDRIFEADVVRDCLSLMYSCGMYDYSGEFAFKIGFPAKSGVAGALLVVIPNVMGICTWSPPLDMNGNSVRGIDFCERLSREWNFHVYDRIPSDQKKTDPTLYQGNDNEKALGQVIEAAAKDDLATIKLAHSLNGQDILGMGDYDLRTALHLASTENNFNIVKYLVEVANVKINVKDRWGKTPFDDATNAGNGEIATFLSKQSSPQ